MKPSALAKTTEIISALFILLFVYTATSKLMTHRLFTITLAESPLLNFASGFIGWAIPLIEILISMMLFVPSFRRGGLVASLILMIVFTIYIVYMLMTASHLPCSCGGIINKLSWKQHLWLNVFLAALAATGLYLSNRLKSLLQ